MVKEVTEVVKEVSEGSHKNTGTEFMTDPTPKEIAAACLEIQSTWTATERMKRLRADLRPMYRRCDGERLEMSSSVYERHHERRELITAEDTRNV